MKCLSKIERKATIIKYHGAERSRREEEPSQQARDSHGGPDRPNRSPKENKIKKSAFQAFGHANG
jgi:hypothetical protein